MVETVVSGNTYTSHLNAEACAPLAASIAPATRRSYCKSWDLFLCFVLRSSLPISYIALASFIGKKYASNSSPSSIASHVSDMLHTQNLKFYVSAAMLFDKKYY